MQLLGYGVSCLRHSALHGKLLKRSGLYSRCKSPVICEPGIYRVIGKN